MNYYYLYSFLPTLSLESPPPFSSERFYELCSEHLTPFDYRTLESLNEPIEETSPVAFIAAWRDFEVSLRNALTRIRAGKLKRDASAEIKPTIDYSMETEKAVSEAMARPSPIEREAALDKIRWKKIEDLAGLDPFASQSIFSYALRLKIAEKWERVSVQTGTERAEKIINAGSPDHSAA